MFKMRTIARKTYRKVFPSKEGEKYVNHEGEGSVGLVDVGAVGRLPSPWYENAPSISHLLKFEPRDEKEKHEDVTTLSTALWKCKEKRPFYILQGKGGTGSSLLQPNPEFVREHFDELCKRGPQDLAETWFERSKVVRTERVQCRTLDSILSSISHSFHFLKLDVQGAEMQVLRGAEQFMERSCLGLHLELFKYPLYKGMSLIDDIVDFLQKNGFEMYIKNPPHGTFNSQHDCIFLRRGKESDAKNVIQSIYEIPT